MNYMCVIVQTQKSYFLTKSWVFAVFFNLPAETKASFYEWIYWYCESKL